MKRKIVSVLILLVLLTNLLPVSLVNAANEKIIVTITADKTSAKQGDVINYTITCNATEKLSSIQLALDIPTGLTYVANSGAIASNLKSVIGDVTEASYTEAEKLILVAHYLPFTLTGDVTIATFQCTVDNGASGNYEVSLKDVEFTDSKIDVIADTEYKLDTGKTVVVVPVTGVTLNKTKTTINAGATENLIATIVPAKATNKKISWESNDSTIATVSDTGVVTGIKPGNAVIKITTDDGKFFATCDVTVVCAHANTTTHPAVSSTCEVQGNNEYVTCNDCKKVITGSDEKLPLEDHNYGTLITKVDPIHTLTQLVDGTKAHYICSVCNQLFDENKNKTTAEDLVIKAPSHAYGNWKNDASNHWKECGCGIKVEEGAHQASTPVKENIVPATCTTDGSHDEVVYCSVCNYKMSTNLKIDQPTGHSNGTPVKENIIPATCTTDGSHDEVVKCTTCCIEMSRTNKIDKATGHTEGTVVIENKVEATVEKEGSYEEVIYCVDCEEELSRTKKTTPKFVYEILEGADFSHVDKENKEITIIANGKFDKFEGIKVDGKLIDKSNYTAKEGSTIVTLKADYLNTLSVGEHKIAFVYDDGEVETTFKIAEKIETTNDKKEPTTPKTGDESNMTVWKVGLVVSGILFVILLGCKIKGTRKKGRH